MMEQAPMRQFSPTVVAPRICANGSTIVSMPISTAQSMVMEAHRNSFARAVGAGVKIAMGTDSGVLPHGRNLEELLLMAEGGMSPREVLVATTRSAADRLGIGDDTGTLSLGKRADVVAVAGDPLDLDSLRANIRAVYQDGRLVRGAVGA